MVTLNLRNIEQIIFRNNEVRKLLPEFEPYFQQWALAQMNPYLRNVGKQAVIDLLDALNDRHSNVISNFLKIPVQIDKLNLRVVTNFGSDIFDLKDELKEMNEIGHYVLYREEDQAYISVWR